MKFRNDVFFVSEIQFVVRLLFSKFKLCGGLISVFFIFSQISGNSQSKPINSGSFREGFVDIGYHRLFANYNNPQDANFTVIFETGAGGNSNDWALVKSLLPSDIATLTYDRAGSGKSEAGPLPRTMAQEVFELHQLIKSIKFNGPVILVGQSIGGLLVRLYTEKYGKNVAGVILVDPTHENSVLGSMKYGGWVRLREKARGIVIPKPQLKMKESRGYDSGADYMAEEFQKIYLSDFKNPQQLKNRPLVVLCAGKRNQPPGTPDEQWKELRAERDKQVQELTVLSANSRYIFDPESSHQIQNDDPEIIVKAIRMVIISITSKTRL